MAHAARPHDRVPRLRSCAVVRRVGPDAVRPRAVEPAGDGAGRARVPGRGRRRDEGVVCRGRPRRPRRDTAHRGQRWRHRRGRRRARGAVRICRGRSRPGDRDAAGPGAGHARRRGPVARQPRASPRHGPRRRAAALPGRGGGRRAADRGRVRRTAALAGPRGRDRRRGGDRAGHGPAVPRLPGERPAASATPGSRRSGCSTRSATTASPGWPTGRCSGTGSPPPWPRRDRRRCCSSTWTTSRPSTTCSATASATGCSSRSRSCCAPRSAIDGLPVRVGGDEFAVLLTGADADPEELAGRLLAALNQPDQRAPPAGAGQHRHRRRRARRDRRLGAARRRRRDVHGQAARQGQLRAIRRAAWSEPVLAHMQLGGELRRALDDGEFRRGLPADPAAGRPAG